MNVLDVMAPAMPSISTACYDSQWWCRIFTRVRTAMVSRDSIQSTSSTGKRRGGEVVDEWR